MKKNVLRRSLLVCIVLLQTVFMFLPVLSLAQTTGGGSFVNPIQYSTIEDLLIAVLNAVVLILFPIIILMLVYCGFAFISARGNPTKIAEARKVFFWTLIGGLIILGAKALALAIAATVKEIQGP